MLKNVICHDDFLKYDTHVLGRLRVWSELAAMRYCMEGPVDSDSCDMRYTRLAMYVGKTAGNPRSL